MEFQSPSEALDYQHNLTNELGVDTIASSVWAVATGITKDSDSFTTSAATIWISGGTSGQTYKITNTVVTSTARTHVKDFYIRIQEQRAG